MRIKITGEEQSSQFELAFPGTYQAVVADQQANSGPKGPYIRWGIDLIGVERNADGAPLGGKRAGRVFETTTLAEGKRWRLSELAKSAGLNPSDFESDDILGKTVTVQIEVEKDEGYSPRNKVKKFLAS